MKKFVNAELNEMNIAETAFGPENPNQPDSDKTAVRDDDGNLLGWKQQFGEANKNSL